jgi:hypothetical protein
MLDSTFGLLARFPKAVVTGSRSHEASLEARWSYRRGNRQSWRSPCFELFTHRHQSQFPLPLRGLCDLCAMLSPHTWFSLRKPRCPLKTFATNPNSPSPSVALIEQPRKSVTFGVGCGFEPHPTHREEIVTRPPMGIGCVRARECRVGNRRLDPIR